eukprot:2010776-Amphidinium_carterae.1
MQQPLRLEPVVRIYVPQEVIIVPRLHTLYIPNTPATPAPQACRVNASKEAQFQFEGRSERITCCHVV